MKQSLRYGLVAMMSVCVIALAGCNSQDLKLDLGKQTTVQSTTSEDKKAMDKMTKIVVYVPRQDGKGVMPQPLTIDKERKTVKDAINLMIEQDGRAEYPVFAKGTKVVETSKHDDIVTVVLNDDFLQDATGLTATLRIASIVNTAVEFDGVHKVYVKVKGVTLPTYGNIDLTRPLKQMKDKIVKD
ncbi:GerMN domain-containing protein [Veillonella sp. DNF00869]|uniref:GerMN domain-containing protein n=1 Tax=Veillonella sp. DNF00869 TaxID=1384081 RepID=UPI0007846227|nr:GerMN domain-containing protein [Veillonella sp. DNF00869]KXB86939.1 hypothetical protein HMPREF3032_01288 [Veillonella sp. DNF00869]